MLSGWFDLRAWPAERAPAVVALQFNRRPLRTLPWPARPGLRLAAIAGAAEPRVAVAALLVRTTEPVPRINAPSAPQARLGPSLASIPQPGSTCH